MALNNLGLGLVFTAKNFASPVILKINRDLSFLEKRANKSGSKISKAFQGIGTAALGASAALGVGGLLGTFGSLEAAKVGGRFAQGLAKLGNISMATAGQLDAMGEKAFETAIKTQFSPDQAIEGMTELAQQGFAAREAMEALNPVMDLAAGGQLSVAQSSATVGAALNAFSLSAEHSTEVTDKMFRITQLTALKADELEGVMGKLGRTVGITGQSIDNALISVGFIRSTGVQATEAANAVSRALIEVSKKADDFRALGIEVTDVNGKFRALPAILLDMKKGLAGSRDEAERAKKAYALLGRFGVSAFAALESRLKKGIVDRKTGKTLYGIDALELMQRQMADASGTAKKFRDDFLNTFTGQGVLLRGAAQGIAVAVGEPFAKILKPLVGGLVDVFSFLAKNIRALPSPLKKIIAAFIAFTSVTMLLVAALGILTVAIGALMAFAAPILLFFAKAAILLAPLTLLVTGLGLGIFTLASALNRGAASNKLLEKLRMVRLVFSGLIDLFSGKRFSEEVSAEFKKADSPVAKWITILGRAGFKIASFVIGVKEGFEAVLDTMGPTIDALVESLSGLFKEIFAIDISNIFDEEGSARETGRSIGLFIGDLGKKIVQTFTDATNWFKNFVKSFKKFYKSDLEPIIEIFKESMSSLADHFGSANKKQKGFVIAAKAIISVVKAVMIVFIAFIKILDTALTLIKEIAGFIKSVTPGQGLRNQRKLDSSFAPYGRKRTRGLDALDRSLRESDPDFKNKAAALATKAEERFSFSDPTLLKEILRRQEFNSGTDGVGEQAKIGLQVLEFGRLDLASQIAKANQDKSSVDLSSIKENLVDSIVSAVRSGMSGVQLKSSINVDGQSIANVTSSVNQSNAEYSHNNSNIVHTELE